MITSCTPINGPAPSHTNQPTTTYLATLPPSMFNPLVGDPIQGTISAIGHQSGVHFSINISNLPSQTQYGPFAWHIHTMPVPADGNCTATLGHLDPQNGGELYTCNAAAPATCQVGDLAGKHGGKITAEGVFSTQFVDPFLSTDERSVAFFGGLAFVLHTANTSRITCANFEMIGGADDMLGNGTEGGNATATATATRTGVPAEFTGAAAGKLVVGAVGVVAGFAAVAVVL